METLLRNEVLEIYSAFITTAENNSVNTAKNYESRIKEFFAIIFNKDIAEVTKSDLKKMKAVNVDTYANILIAKGNSKGTIITKLRSIKSFFKQLSINGVIDYSVDMFKPKMKTDETHHDSLYNMEEVERMYDFVLSKRKNHAYEQYVFVKSLFVTANRKSAMMNLTWSDIKKKFDYATGESVWVIEVLDKGSKLIEKPIANEFYNELLSMKVEGEERVFPNMTDDVIRGTMRAFTDYMDDGRNLTIHSIKASALTIAYKLTKDIMKVKQLGSHADISTTQIYIRDEKSYTEQLSYKLHSNIDTSKIKELSHDELLKIIMDNEDLKYAVALKI